LSRCIPPWEDVRREDFETIASLGSGSFAEVRLVKYRGDGKQYAMKSIKKDIGREMDLVLQGFSTDSALVERDVGVAARQWRSPFIVELYATFQTPDKLHYIFELCPGGDLFDVLLASGRFEECVARFYLAEISMALVHLHEHDTLHRDLRLENVMLAKDGHIKIADFGNAFIGDPRQRKFKECSGEIPETRVFMPPEFWRGEHYGKELDCWQLGVAAYAMFTGSYPAFDGCALRKKKCKLSKAGWDLCAKLLAADRQCRLGYPDGAILVQAHPFFQSLDWSSVESKGLVPPFQVDDTLPTESAGWLHDTPANATDLGRMRFFTWTLGPNEDSDEA